MINEILGHQFSNPLLLKQALTHPSLCTRNNSELKNYERLELLGDSVLSLVIAELLMAKFPEEDEGKIAKRRASLVAGETLSQIAILINLGNKIFMTEAEAKSGGRENVNNLENALEAVIGAIYLDAGLDKLKLIIHDLWQDLFESMIEVPTDPKSKLQEILQKKGYPLPQYELISSDGPKHMLSFKVRLKAGDFQEVVGQGRTKQQAEKEAASLLLKLMNE